MEIIQELKQYPVPARTETYSPVPNDFLYDRVTSVLQLNGFNITKERLILNNGKVMHLALRLESSKDNEIKPAFHVINSYNKSTTLTFAGGAEVVACSNGMVVAETSARRKHTKNLSEEEIHNMLNEQVNYLITWYNMSVEFKTKMVDYVIDELFAQSLLGQMFYGKKLLSPNVASAIQKEYVPEKINTMWDLYNLVTNNMKKNHLVKYISNHKEVYNFINYVINKFNQESKLKTNE